ncbi:ATP-binding protein [Streptomyces pseudogriseolus]|uniref:Regulatory protein n=2 Tax=Streptomyces pseudogriseolus TaxID=36817 RepID=M3CWZ8_STREZ|nr:MULTISPECIES: ATP-binding protein [Streptomyces]EMF28638.1 regulatory protein [Streptomyces gancidicus BKS 13-15]GGS32866.1 ATP-binding protein [Streptomyces rubiginosus]
MKPDTVGLPDSLGGEVIRVTDTDGDRATWSFPADPDAVRAARRAVRAQLARWELDGVADLAALLVSELVTNALRHATGPVGVCLTRPSGRSGVLLVEVSDPVPEPPHERVARPDDEGGRGLQLLARSSRRWGHRSGPHGKTVWCELVVPR